MEIKTRKEAALAGEKRYSTGKPCIKGHEAVRYTSTGICCRCNVESSKRYQKDVQLVMNAKLRGDFIYPLHPDDHAKALAYCQGLDFDRGRMPHDPCNVVAPAAMTTEMIEKERLRIFGLALTNSNSVDDLVNKRTTG